MAQLVEQLRRLGERAIVGIDGVTGAGKSTLAQSLAESLTWQQVSIDEFVKPDQGGYVEKIRYDELERVLDARVGSVLLDGICLLRVLNRLGLMLDLHVYLKRLTSAGRWDDEDSWRMDEPEVLGVTQHFLTTEWVNYHRACQPHLTADIVFVRREIDPGQVHQ